MALYFWREFIKYLLYLYSFCQIYQNSHRYLHYSTAHSDCKESNQILAHEKARWEKCEIFCFKFTFNKAWTT